MDLGEKAEEYSTNSKESAATENGIKEEGEGGKEGGSKESTPPRKASREKEGEREGVKEEGGGEAQERETEKDTSDLEPQASL